MLVELAEFSQKLQEYRAIQRRLEDQREAYRQRRERLSKLGQRRRSDVKKSDVECYMCNASIALEDANSFATCRGCERLVCRTEANTCSEWIPAIGIWECRNCHSSRVIQQKAGEWLLNQLTSRLQKPGPVNLAQHDNLLGLNALDSDDTSGSASPISSNQKVKVREFIEELLSSILNGPLDDVSVGQLLQNESYLPLCEGQKEPVSPSDQHFELRKLLHRILEEVAKLPELLNQSGLPLRPEEHLPYFSPKKYEQLLATAVLNKVVEDYRNPKNFEDVDTKTKAGPPSTGANSAGSAKPPPASSGTFDINHNKVPGTSTLNAANLMQMSLDTEEDVQSKEELYQRSLSESDESYLSDYIQKHTVPLPDLSDTTGSGSGPEDDLVSLKSNVTDGTWEENWLFKKRQLKTTESSIAMLVPSPTEEVKALIGDQNVDEVSDLSEAGSDVEGYDSDTNKDTTTTSKSSVRNLGSLEDAVQDSLVSISSLPGNELSEAKNSLLLVDEATNGTGSAGDKHFVDDLISIEPMVEKTEASNDALLAEKLQHLDEVETDDIKLMQSAPKNQDGEGRPSKPDGQPAECDRKEVPIDRAQDLEQRSEVTNGHKSVDDGAEEEKLIPGSIAERDILKWRNASPIANNPYSPDVLQKRLSDSGRRSNLADYDRLASKEPVVEVPARPHSSLGTNEEQPPDADRSLQSVVGANPTQYQRYGRDYYVNDAKRASGSRKQTPDIPNVLPTVSSHGTDDEKSLLLSQQQDQGPTPQASPLTSPVHRSGSSSRRPSSPGFPFVKANSCGNVITAESEDIFSAGRPVEVSPTDPVLKKATKLAYLSTPAHEIYLIPADEPVGVNRSSDTSMTSRADDSLTFSEDSDVTRIYEIGTGETTVVLGDAITAARAPSVTPPPTPMEEGEEEEQQQDKPAGTGDEREVMSEEILEIIPSASPTVPTERPPTPPSSPSIDRSHLLKPRYVQIKQLSPETIRFFAPKKAFTGSTSNLSNSLTLSQSSTDVREFPSYQPSNLHASIHIDCPASRSVPSHEFIIEKEVMDVLPSVKELAKCYNGSQLDISALSKPIQKPRDFIRQSSDMLHEELDVLEMTPRSGMPHVPNKNRRMYSSTSSINAAEEIREIRRLNLDTYNRPTFVPMAPGHSITARSLSKQIREELKTNATDDHKVQGGHVSPERPSSPVFAPGHLRSSIQFFESLRNK